MRRLVLVLLSALLLLPAAAQADQAAPPATSASAAVLMDGESGRVLYGENIQEPMLIASTTKLMTALVAAEQGGDLDQIVVIRPEWVGVEGSSIYLKAGEEISLRGLLYGLLLQSGNDAARAIACHVAGDEESFARKMNEKAAQLGMEHSSFANASGLNQEGHYSTAYDMALLAQACLAHPVVSEICATQHIRVGNRTLVNHNKLLQRYPGCVGMKTGYTQLAGRTLVSAARRDGRTLICVTLDDRDDWRDHAALLDYGFSQYRAAALCTQGEEMGRAAVSGSLLPNVAAGAARSLAYPLAEGEDLTMEVVWHTPLSAPVEQGKVVGQAQWLLEGRVVAQVELIALHGAPCAQVSQRSWWERLLGRGA